MLIEHDAAVDSVNGGCTPLQGSADGGHWEVVSALIEAGANPDSHTPDGETPLFSAASKGHVEATRVLLRAQVNAVLPRTDNLGGSYIPLDMAAHNGHSGVVGELVQQLGIEACGGPSAGLQALRLATQQQRLYIMDIFSSAGVVDDTGIVLRLAVGDGHLASVKLLLQQQQKEGRLTTGGRADVNNTYGPFGAPPLLYAIGFAGRCSPKIVRLLVDGGAATSSRIRVNGESVFATFNDTPLAFTDKCLSNKIVAGRAATEEELNGLKAVRCLLMRVEAVHAVSWLWTSNAPRIACTTESSTRVKRTSTSPTPMTSMLSVLRRRASMHRRVMMSALFRYSKEP